MTVAWHRSIKKRLSLIILSVAMITGFMGYSAFVSWNLLKQQQQTQEYAAILAQILSKDFAELILLDDIQVAADINAKLGSFELLQAAVIHGRNGVAVFNIRPVTAAWKLRPYPHQINVRYNAPTTICICIRICILVKHHWGRHG